MGFMGTDKSAVCRLLAKKLDKKLISTYDELSKKMPIRTAKFVKNHGLNKFYELESEVIGSLSDLDDCVFDTSLSAALRNENVINLKRNSLVILLTAGIKKLPSGLNSQDSPENESKYEKSADYIIDTSSLSQEDVCDLIVHYLQTENGN